MSSTLQQVSNRFVIGPILNGHQAWMFTLGLILTPLQ